MMFIIYQLKLLLFLTEVKTAFYFVLIVICDKLAITKGGM